MKVWDGRINKVFETLYLTETLVTIIECMMIIERLCCIIGSRKNGMICHYRPYCSLELLLDYIALDTTFGSFTLLESISY
jgi:hypothetical protein